MPLYEYECTKCGERLEALQKVGDPPLTTCPQCGGELKKRLSAPAFQFKGSGWYVTDYAGKGRESKKDEAPKAEEKAAKPTEAGSESGKSGAAAKPEKPPAAAKGE